MSGAIETICGNNWKNNLSTLTGTMIKTEENRLKQLISEAKVQPDITEIENELNKTPPISLNFDYQSEMTNLVADDDGRKVKKAELINQIKQLRVEEKARLEKEEKELQRQEQEKQQKLV